MSREAPIRMRRIRNRNTAPTQRDAEQQPRVERELLPGDAGVQIVDGVLQDPRRQQLDRRRHEDAGEAEHERATVAEDVRQEPTKRGAHGASITVSVGGRRSAVGARRSALGARRAALGARRSALGARRSASSEAGSRKLEAGSAEAGSVQAGVLLSSR